MSPLNIHFEIYNWFWLIYSRVSKKNLEIEVVEKHFQLFLASGDCCRLLITFESSLDPDQDTHSVGPYMDPNHLKRLSLQL